MPQTKTILSIIAICISTLVWGQKHQGEYTLLLKSGHKQLTENVKQFSSEIFYERDEIVAGYVYRYIQFYELPDEKLKQAITAVGIKLLEYVPHKTYTAAIPINLDLNQLERLNVRSFFPIAANDKKDITLIEQPYGEWAIKGNQIEVVLKCHNNISQTWAQRALQNRTEVLESNLGNNMFSLLIPVEEIDDYASLPFVSYIEIAAPDASPEDLTGQISGRSNNTISSTTGIRYNGQGIHVAIGDDGMIGPHIDFKARTEQSNVNGDIEGAHGEMVAGILMGAGNLDPTKEGIASGAFLHVYPNFDAVKSASNTYLNSDVMITSTSYSDGCNRGYSTFAQSADEQVKKYPSLMHVFSAGNTGDQDCGYGAGAGWGNITGGVKMGKNVLAVGNVDAYDVLADNSSRGPADDGRIKPDLVAFGTGQESTAPGNSYQTGNGSSAAAPGVAGALAQLYQAYQEMNNSANPPSALIKAAVLNTADDLGNVGPDFSYGWGRINTKKALELLEEERYLKDSIQNNQVQTFTFDVPENSSQLKVMIYWHDRAGSPTTSKALVNDIDFSVTAPTGNFQPWLLDPTADASLLLQPATYGNDDLNNVEQITIDNPIVGEYTITVEGAEIVDAQQIYYITFELIKNEIAVVHPVGNETFVPGEVQRINWDAFGNQGNFSLEYSSNNGNTWTGIAQVDGAARTYDWLVPNESSGQMLVRVMRNGLIGESTHPFHVFEIPQNFTIAKICPDTIRLVWDPVDNAVAYTIYRLGFHYMDSLTTVTSNYAALDVLDPIKENWYAVQAIGNTGQKGRRSLAISDGIGLYNCEINHDVSIQSISSPVVNTTNDCHSLPISVSVNIRNSGTAMQATFPVYYQYDNEPVVMEIYDNSIPAGLVVNYVFDTPLQTGDTGEHLLKIWTGLNLDEANYNDTLRFHLNVIPSTSFTIPYFQNFESFDYCGVPDKCDVACPLTAGWTNDQNSIGDQVDWHVNQLNTPTYLTGPNADQNTEDGNGQYLYVEGSNGCYQTMAQLLSPCFDLTDVSFPTFSFWYHMNGADMGALHLDIFDGTEWHNNIIFPIVGDQGEQWKKAEVNLESFAGNLVNVRFRAEIGDGYLSDIAIDNIAFYDAHTPPITAFSVDKREACTDQVVHFYDNSFNTPTSWEWFISPDINLSYMEGTSKNSPNPVIVFYEPGTYIVSLKTTNDYGSYDMLTINNFILVSDGVELSVKEDFEDEVQTEVQWDIENPDGNIGWEVAHVIGSNDEPTKCLYMNNHSYNAPSQRDWLSSKILDLTNITNPQIRFDIAYARYNDFFSDRFDVRLSDDCGENFDNIIYSKTGNDLATVANHNSGWAPSSSDEWRTEVIDLSDYAGNSIALQLVNICGFGNNFYLDNILVYERDSFPEAAINVTPAVQQICLGSTLTFVSDTDNSNNIVDEYQWDFGEAANPMFANDEGPHTIEFLETGIYEIKLKAINNELGFDESVTTIEVVNSPIANFDFQITNGVYFFSNLSEWGTSYHWDFGDDQTSDVANPIHEFENNALYTVKLTVSNACGETTLEEQIEVGTNVSEISRGFELTVSPNPTTDFIELSIQTIDLDKVDINIFDTQGRLLYSDAILPFNYQIKNRIELSEFTPGVYFIAARTAQATAIQKLVILDK